MARGHSHRRHDRRNHSGRIFTRLGSKLWRPLLHHDGQRYAIPLHSLMSQLMRVWDIHSHTTTAYHPEANGLVERLHRRLKEALLAASHDRPDEWFWKLPLVMLSIRTTLMPDLGASSAEMLYGKPIAVPGCLLSQHPSSNEQLQHQQRSTLSNLRLEVERLQPVPTKPWQYRLFLNNTNANAILSNIAQLQYNTIQCNMLKYCLQCTPIQMKKNLTVLFKW